jgi:uncharacterized protein
MRWLPLALALTLSACAAPKTDPMPDPPKTRAYADRFGMMEMCVPVKISSEIIDFTVEDATPSFEHRTIIAELAQTQADRQRGLGGRDEIQPDTAMIFEFAGDHNPVLWMAHVTAPLDMIWIDDRGAAFYIETDTIPGSQAFLTPEDPEPVGKYVLELPSGQAERLNIHPGSTIIELGTPARCREI